MVLKLKRLMRDRTIPKKRIVQIPVSAKEIQNGGAIRCQTFGIPSNISHCSQNNVNNNLKILKQKTSQYLSDIENGNLNSCSRAESLLAKLEVIIDYRFKIISEMYNFSSNEIIHTNLPIIDEIETLYKELRNVFQKCG